jgi:uncharacterized protein YdeI (BOF family)
MKKDMVSLKAFWLANFSPAKMSPAVILPAIAFTSALLVALTVAVFLTSQAAAAQGVSPSPTATQEPAAQPDNPSSSQPPETQPDSQSSNNQTMQPVAVEQTFSGKIVKAGSHFVLLDATNSTTFELDNQQKAHQFLNKSVKVKGILDATTGTIRISAIDPA